MHTPVKWTGRLWTSCLVNSPAFMVAPTLSLTFQHYCVVADTLMYGLIYQFYRLDVSHTNTIFAQALAVDFMLHHID